MAAALPRALLVALLCSAACGRPAAVRSPALAHPSVPRLLPPPQLDPSARGAVYLSAVALRLQPGWGEFLDDCRFRLPAGHPLNRMTLAATAELSIDRAGRVIDVRLTPSGNTDFDRAVRDAITDAAPLPAPPTALLSDDDRLHLRWLFARDRRQAGPATAAIVDVELPVDRVIPRLVAAGDLARAARRLARAPAGAARTAQTRLVMIAALREALASPDTTVRRAAVEAIGEAHLTELAPEVRGLLAVTSDAALRLTAIAAAVALDDHAAAEPLRAQLPTDLPEHLELAIAETRALVALGRGADAAAAIRARLAAGDGPSAIALAALAYAPVPALAGRLAAWMRSRDARIRAAVCTALAGSPPAAAWRGLARGLADPDATVRAACAESAAAAGHRDPRVARRAVAHLRRLARDRDRTVRARAVAAIATLDPAHAVRALDDPAAEVRASFAGALAAAPPSRAAPDLRQLIEDRDPVVRAAAWTTLAAGSAALPERAKLAARAATDPAPQVRLAAIPAITDAGVLERLARGDEAPEVRTAACVQLARRRGRAASADGLLAQLAGAPRGSAERVRTALAWLLAR